MNAQEKIPLKIVRLAKRLRSTGWWFLVLGAIASIYPIAILFDPQATIQVNGVPTNDLFTKLGIAAFVLIFPVMGAFLAFTSKEKFERWLKKFDSRAKAFGQARFGPK